MERGQVQTVNLIYNMTSAQHAHTWRCNGLPVKQKARPHHYLIHYSLFYRGKYMHFNVDIYKMMKVNLLMGVLKKQLFYLLLQIETYFYAQIGEKYPGGDLMLGTRKSGFTSERPNRTSASPFKQTCIKLQEAQAFRQRCL